jgi:integrase
MEHAKASKRSWLRDEQMLKHMKDFFGSQTELTEITPAEIEGFKLSRRKKVSGSTVNRELALLKRMFNLAIDWDLFREVKPMRKVKFFKEFNTGVRVVSPDEEGKLLRNAAPYIQDVIRFALNTGLRTGEIFTLRWSHVDFEKNVLAIFAPKTQKTRVVPMNSETPKVLEAWALGRKSEFVFYNLDSGQPFVDLKAGFRAGMSKGKNRRGDVAYAAAHIRFAPGESGRGYSDSPAVARTFGDHRNHALYPHKSRLKACGASEARKVW